MELSDSDQIKLVHKRLFATLLADPDKKAKVLELLTNEGLVQRENISPYATSKESKFNSSLKKLHEMMSSTPKLNKRKIESPSALGRRRALQRLKSDSSLDEQQERSAEILIRRPSNTPEVPYNEILNKCIIYCEVRSNGEDRSSSIKSMVRALGALVRDKITRDVTHVIFKDGLYSTFRKAQNMKMHIVSVLWLDAVRRCNCRMPENKYKPLDFDKYVNMNESQVCQEIEAEFNDVVTDEIRRSAIKKTKFSDTNEILNNSEQNVSNPDLREDDNRFELSPNIRCSTPALINDFNNISKSENQKNNNKEFDFVPCSQNDSNSFTHKRKSIDLSKIVEETFNDRSVNTASPSTTNIAKHARDSFELKKIQKLKSPPEPKNISNRSSKSSLNDENSLHLHITTTTDRSSNSTRRRSSSNYAQKFISNDTTKSNERISTSTRSSTISTDLLNGPLNANLNKSRRRTICGLTRDKKIDVPVLKENENINEKTNSLLNNVDSLLNKEVHKETTIKKVKARKLFKADQVDESLFNWDNAKNVPPDVTNVITTTKKRKVEIPLDFPKAPKSSKQVSTVKKSTKKQKIPKETLAKILDFDHNDPGKKIPCDSSTKIVSDLILGVKEIEENSEKNLKNKDEVVNTVRKRRSTKNSVNPIINKTLSSSEDIENDSEMNKRPKRKSIVPVNYKISDEIDENLNKPLSAMPDVISNQINVSDKTGDESFKSATSVLSSIAKSKKRYSTITISTISSNNSDDDNHTNKSPIVQKTNKRKSSRILIHSSDDNFSPPKAEKIVKNNKRKSRRFTTSTASEDSPKHSQITEIPKSTPGRITRQSIIQSTPVSKINSPLKIKTPNTRTKIIPKTPVTAIQNVDKSPNRRSTLEFKPHSSRKSLARIKASQEPKKIPVKISTIVCTRFHRADTQVFEQIVTKIGGFVVENEVTKRTTHLVCSGLTRTINLVRAIARGCWILRKEWLYKSLEAGRWLAEEDYEMVEFSPAVQKCRLQKQSFGSLFSMDLFKDNGTIFISRGSNPRCSDLEELVQLCGGRIVRIVRNADIIVGERIRNDNNNSISVTEKWILDSISEYKKKSFKTYAIPDSTDL